MHCFQYKLELHVVKLYSRIPCTNIYTQYTCSCTRKCMSSSMLIIILLCIVGLKFRIPCTTVLYQTCTVVIRKSAICQSIALMDNSRLLAGNVCLHPAMLIELV